MKRKGKQLSSDSQAVLADYLAEKFELLLKNESAATTVSSALKNFIGGITLRATLKEYVTKGLARIGQTKRE